MSTILSISDNVLIIITQNYTARVQSLQGIHRVDKDSGVYFVKDNVYNKEYRIGGFEEVSIGLTPVASEPELEAYFNAFFAQLANGAGGEPVTLLNDSSKVTSNDLNLSVSDNGNFSGTITDYFGELTITNYDITGAIPKVLSLWFTDTVYASDIGLGCNDLATDFGQVVTIKLLGSGEVVRRTIISDVGDKNSRIISFAPSAFNGIIIEFNTTQPVGLSNITIRKESQVLSRIQGLDPNGVLKDVNTNVLGNLLVSLDEQKDAFGRLKMAEPYTIFDSSLTNSISDDLFWTELKGGAVSSLYDRSKSCKELNVTSSGDYIVRQTKQRFKYQPAKSHEFFITGVLSTESFVRKRVGLVDYDNIGIGLASNVPQNGVFFENNSGVLSWNIANNGVITESVNQSNWNIDTADGTGRSGFSFNPNAANIFTAQLEWLGVGVVLVGFATGGGSVVYVHAFQHASIDGFVDVYMRTANLPVSYEITALAAVTGSMKCICSSVISGGGFNPKGNTNSIQNTTGVAISNRVTELLVGIRLSGDNFEYTIDPVDLAILTTSNGNSLWSLSINPTYTGSVTWTQINNSVCEGALNNNNEIITEGYIIAKGSVSNNLDNLDKELSTALRIGKDLLGNLDELWLSVTALGNETYHGTLNFKELI